MTEAPTEVNGRPILYWCAEGMDCERLTATTLDEAVADWTQHQWPTMPETVAVKGYARMPADYPRFDARWLAETLLEDLDEEHANGEADGSEPTPRQLELCKTFLAEFLQEYTPHWCEDILSVEVDVREWIRDHTRDDLHILKEGRNV